MIVRYCVFADFVQDFLMALIVQPIAFQLPHDTLGIREKVLDEPLDLAQFRELRKTANSLILLRHLTLR